MNEGTEGGIRPFWSPGSDFIGDSANGQMSKIPVQGGPAITLCPLPGVIHQFFGGTWSPDGRSIVFTSSSPVRLFEVSDRGGSPKLLIEPHEFGRGDSLLLSPFPARRLASGPLLFTLGRSGEGEIVVQNLETGDRKTLGAWGAVPHYSPSGHILYTPAAYQAEFCGLCRFPFRRSR